MESGTVTLGLVSLAAILLLPALPPAALRLEYRLDDAGLLAIAWSGAAASGGLKRQLTAEDLAMLESLARAASQRGSEWRAPSSRAADLLLGGIEPLGAVKRLIVAIPRGALLRRIPFEALGSPPLIERFTVWYEPVTGQSSGAAPLARLWALPGDVSVPFLRRYEEQLSSGLEPVEALRRVKTEWLGSGAERAHPFYWAGFTIQRGSTSPLPGHTISSWFWAAGFTLALGGAALLLWWRRGRFELL